MQNQHTTGLFLSVSLFVMVIIPGCPSQQRPDRALPLARELPSEHIIPVSHKEISCPIQVMMDECEGDVNLVDDSILEY